MDLYPIVRQAVRCGVESYSIKKLEQYSGYIRRVELKSASQPLMAVELALESQAPDAITSEIRDAVQGYNEDDCRSTEGLRDWLESLRDEALAAGEAIARPQAKDGDAAKAVSDLQQEVDDFASGCWTACRSRPAIPVMRSTRGGCWHISSTGIAARRTPSGGSTSG